MFICLWQKNHHTWLIPFRITIVILCAIWYHLWNSKNVKNAHGGVLLLAKFATLLATFATLLQPATLLKITLLQGSFSRFSFFELWEWYQIMQRITIDYSILEYDWPSVTEEKKALLTVLFGLQWLNLSF